ncbi:MAG: Gfo/Idh/MocA family oxidoreductase [Verrucomicrobiota bacterium]
MKTHIAFIGAGDISWLHAEAIRHCPSTELAGIWSEDDQLNEEKSIPFQCQIYESVEELIADPHIDSVFILTNIDSHATYAMMAMNAGKNILIEKPVASTVDELLALKACAEKNQVVLMPGHNYIYEPALTRSKELIDTKKLGDLVAIYIQYHIHHPEEVAQRYPGVIRHILTHHAYILLHLAGEPESLSAMKSVIHYENFTGEDIAMVNLKMKSGALAHFSADFAADDHSSDPWTFVIKVIGSKGSTRFSYRDWVENQAGVVHSHTFSAYEHHIREEVRFFVENCVQNRECPLSTIDDAITCQKIIEACETSVAENRHVNL